MLDFVGLDRRLFGSVGCVGQRLKAMNKKKMDLVREAFAKCRHGRFLKEFFNDVPFGRAADYKKRVKKASIQQLASLIKVCGFLLQKKVYVFWPRNHDHSARSVPNT